MFHVQLSWNFDPDQAAAIDGFKGKRGARYQEVRMIYIHAKLSPATARFIEQPPSRVPSAYDYCRQVIMIIRLTTGGEG